MQGLLLTSLVLSVYCYSIVAIEPWKKIDVTGTKPSGLWHTLTFRNGTSMLLFGGGIKRNNVWSFYNDLWRINLLSEKPKWEIVIPDGQAASPPKRFGSAGVKLGNKMYMRPCGLRSLFRTRPLQPPQSEFQTHRSTFIATSVESSSTWYCSSWCIW